MGAPRDTPYNRVMRRTVPEPNTGCLLFTGAIDAKGYGNIRVNQGTRLAHRVVWEGIHGAIGSTELCVCHTCDTPLCVNIEHLFLATRGENNHDARRKGRTCRGERNRDAKLSETDVLAIRSACVDAPRGIQLSLSRQYKVSPTTISRIARGVTWKHLQEKI